MPQHSWLTDFGVSAVPEKLYLDRRDAAPKHEVKERKPYMRVNVSNKQRNLIRDAVKELMSKGERSHKKIYDSLMNQNLITTEDGNISYFTIRNYTKEYLRSVGIKRKRTKEEVLRLGKEGKSVEEIASALNIQKFVARNYLFHAGLIRKEEEK